jgi:hypothetical protein
VLLITKTEALAVPAAGVVTANREVVVTFQALLQVKEIMVEPPLAAVPGLAAAVQDRWDSLLPHPSRVEQVEQGRLLASAEQLCFMPVVVVVEHAETRLLVRVEWGVVVQEALEPELVLVEQEQSILAAAAAAAQRVVQNLGAQAAPA